MDNIKFYEYAFTILSEAGHVTTSSPIYVNHSSGETLYIDSSKDVATNRFERDLLSLIDNVSLLVDVRWPGVVPELDENVQIYSATVDFSEQCRSQNIADIHHLLQKYWNCTHSIVFFKNKESYLISFADKDRSHILSDWFSITYEWDKIVERVGIENIAIDTCENYFLDFLYATAREYCIRPVSFEEASYGLMPLDYISKSLSSDIPLSRDEIKNMIRDNLLFFELMYGDDYLLQKRLESLMVTTMLNLNTPAWRSEPTITIFRMKSTGLVSNLNSKIQMTRSSLALKMIWMTAIMMTSSMITTKILILQYSMILL